MINQLIQQLPIAKRPNREGIECSCESLTNPVEVLNLYKGFVAKNNADVMPMKTSDHSLDNPIIRFNIPIDGNG
jgi:hypothetical protein